MIRVTAVNRDWLRNLPLLPLNLAPNPIRVQHRGWLSLQEKCLTYFDILVTEEFCSCGPTHGPSACAAKEGITFGLKVPGLLLKASCCSSTTLICGGSILLPGEANPELDRLLHWSEKGHKCQCDRTQQWEPLVPNCTLWSLPHYICKTSWSILPQPVFSKTKGKWHFTADPWTVFLSVDKFKCWLNQEVQACW